MKMGQKLTLRQIAARNPGFRVAYWAPPSLIMAGVLEGFSISEFPTIWMGHFWEGLLMGAIYFISGVAMAFFALQGIAVIKPRKRRNAK